MIKRWRATKLLSRSKAQPQCSRGQTLEPRPSSLFCRQVKIIPKPRKTYTPSRLRSKLLSYLYPCPLLFTLIVQMPKSYGILYRNIYSERRRWQKDLEVGSELAIGAKSSALFMMLESFTRIFRNTCEQCMRSDPHRNVHTPFGVQRSYSSSLGLMKAGKNWHCRYLGITQACIVLHLLNKSCANIWIHIFAVKSGR